MPRLFSLLATAMLTPALLAAQSQAVTGLLPGLARSEGIDVTSSIAFTRLFLTAEAEIDAKPGKSSDGLIRASDLSSPTLTVQCTRKLNGNYAVELFVNFGGVTDASFYRPWRPAKRDDHFAPPTQKSPVTMEFLGYTHVKPIRRQFEQVIEPSGQLRYDPPSGGSSNLEEIQYYFQFLRALPTFRVTSQNHTATFQTAPLLTQIRKEPLCRASAL